MGERSDLSPGNDDLTNFASLSVNSFPVRDKIVFAVNKSSGCYDQVQRVRGCGTLAPQGPGAASMCTTLVDKVSTGTRISKHRFLTKRSRRLYSRIILGMKKVGRYYFVTFALKHGCKSIAWYWVRLRWFLKRYRPASQWCYCLTDEHCGVIHMVIRLGRHEKRWEAKEVRDYWIKLTGFNHVTIRKVRTGTNQTLARYIQDQKKKYGLGKEMSYQDLMIRWNYSRGWLPVGYTRKRNREYGKLMRQNVPDELIQEYLTGLLHLMFQEIEEKK